MRAPFGRDLGDGYSLTLRDLSTVEGITSLIGANIDRLRDAEPWAWTEQTRESIELATERLLAQYALERAVPGVIRLDGRIIGVATLALDSYLQTGSLGYWLDASAEGHGAVHRACTVLIEAARSRGMHRLEIRAAMHNLRSRSVASRLGFQEEGVLRSALPLGERRVDVALSGLVL